VPNTNVSWAIRAVPLMGQLTGYNRAWLGPDLLAGLSVAAVALPAAIAYPSIADLPVQVGLYAAILPAVGYALFGPSRQLMVGPDTATTIMLASALLQLGVAGVDARLAATAALALLAGLLCLLAGLLRFGFIANFLSRPVLLGFLAGVALTLIVGQIKRLTGVSIEASGLLRPLLELAGKLGDIHAPTLAVGLGLFGLLRLLRWYKPRFPGPVAAILIGGVVTVTADLPHHGVAVVGTVRATLPSLQFSWPSGVALDDLLLAAVGIMLVSFVSGIVTARSFAAKNRYSVDANLELLGFGAANIASGLFGGFPVTGSDSRTAVNDAVGGKTQVVGLVAAATLLFTIFFIGDVLAYIPIAALGAVLASAAVDLIDVRGLVALWRLSRIEFLVALVTLIGVVAVGVLHGVVLAVAVTLAHLLWLTSQPRDALLGRFPDRSGLYKLHNNPEARPIPGLIIYLVQAGIVFFNADYVKQRIREIVEQHAGPAKWFILDASAINHLDITAVEVLEDVRSMLAERSVAFGIAELHTRPRTIVEASGLADRMGRKMLFESSEEAVTAFQRLGM